ncbi:hypothetical protein [Paenibacillus roseus]|uniref:hypothetical protein n=1 Tax=Paenibacillus sp. GCM10012307 TaxID=3317343 RepID=UPI0036D355F3
MHLYQTWIQFDRLLFFDRWADSYSYIGYARFGRENVKDEESVTGSRNSGRRDCMNRQVFDEELYAVIS